MALSTLELNTISKSFIQAKKLVEEMKAILDEIDTVYNGAGGIKSHVTQQDLDAVASFNALTTTQLDDGMFALTSTIRGGINTGYAALLQLATRG